MPAGIHSHTMTDITDAYFLPGATHTDDVGTSWQTFTATEHTGSPWGPGFQHGAPPSALVTHLLESATPDGGRLVRTTTDLLGAVPLGELRTSTRVLRPGRRISLVEATVTNPDGREVARGTGWWVRELDTTAIETAVAPDVVPLAEATPDDDPSNPNSFTGRWSGGYIDTLECRIAPGQLWVRSTIPVVAGVPDSPWTRLMAVADVANGTNPTLDPGQWQFMNTDLTVCVHRLPRGTWTCVQADANYGPDGAGLTVGRLYDEDGPVGTTNQALLLEPATPAP
jgi:hypothetical protein